jgi:hypothetical protein
MTSNNIQPCKNALAISFAFADEGFGAADMVRIFRVLRKLGFYQERWPVAAFHFIEIVRPQLVELYSEAVRPHRAKEPNFIQERVLKYLNEHSEQLCYLKPKWFKKEPSLYAFNRSKRDKPDFVNKALQVALSDRGYPRFGLNRLEEITRLSK